MATGYRIRNWDKHFENNRTRDLKKLNWVPIPNSLDGAAFGELADHKNGAAHFGVWIALVEIASKCEPRGALVRSSGKHLDTTDIARMCHFPVKLIEEALERLTQVGWIETVCDDVASKCDNPAPSCDPRPQESAAFQKGMEGNGMEGNSSCPETQASSGPVPVLVYPTDGDHKEWHLTESYVDELRGLFPSLDILQECRNALAWVKADSSRRKTVSGMPRYITNWLTKSQNGYRGRAPTAATASRGERNAQAAKSIGDGLRKLHADKNHN